jgi:chemotaxis protein MotB
MSFKFKAQELGKLPNSVLIEGHTDSRPYPGKDYSNWELSADRANAARKLMEANGLSADQVGEVRGYADRHLRHPEDPANPLNRRISLIVRYRPHPDQQGKPGEGSPPNTAARKG